MWLIKAPRLVLIIITPFFIWEIVLALMICLVSGVKGQCKEITSDWAKSSSRETYLQLGKA